MMKTGKANGIPSDSYTSKMDYMRHIYKRYREAWDGITKDDRLLFCNMYDMHMEALDAMKDIDNNLIWVGYDRVFNEDMEVMDAIIDRFEKGVYAA